MATKKRVKKFNIDKEADRKEYEAILNNTQVQILDEMRAYDKTQGNNMLVTVWWVETETWDLDI